jgi:uncharacterized protein VirK/YbjX
MSAYRENAIRDFRTLLGGDGSNGASPQLLSSGISSISEAIISLIQSAETLHEHHYYLAKTFSTEMKCACLIHHYSFFSSFVSEKAFDALVSKEALIYESRKEANVYTITINVTRDWCHEGELSLEFKVNGNSLYIFSFTLIPGLLAGLPDQHALLISRMQGRAGRFPQIRQATREMSEVSPQAVLYAALLGIAQAIGVQHILGPCAANQVTCTDDKLKSYSQAYDDFFNSIGATGPQDGFYIVSASPPEKPLNSVKPGHRLRTRRKRNLKAEITASVLNSWREFMQLAPENQGGYGPVDAPKITLPQQRELNNCIAKLIDEKRKITELAGMIHTIACQILKRELFDIDWYLAKYPDVRAAGVDPVHHYLKHGAAEGRDPNAFFITRQYLAENPEVQRSGMNPLVHYCLFGASEGRNSVRRQCPPNTASD